MHTSDTINEIAAALAKAQAEISNVVKDAANPHFRSQYATLAAVLDVARPVLAKNGISIMQPAGSDETGNVVVETMLAHSSGQWMRSSIACRPAKADAQGMGSVITYLRRYSLASMVGIAQADDDGEAGSGRGDSPKDANPQMQPARTANVSKTPTKDAPKPDAWEAFFSRDSYFIKADSADDFAKGFVKCCANAPSERAISKLSDDNDGHLKSIPDALYRQCQEAMSHRMAFFAQAPKVA